MAITQIPATDLKDADITDADVASANKDGTAGTPSLRTLGSGAQQAAAGNHTHSAADIISGLVAAVRLGSGTANATTFLRGDQTYAAPTATVTAATVEVNLGNTPVWRGKFTVTDGAISTVSKILVWQAPGPYTGKGTRADEAEMQPVQVIAVQPLTGSAGVMWQTPPLLSGNRRLGRVRGNVKFHYQILG
jgi:hypothetical protein